LAGNAERTKPAIAFGHTHEGRAIAGSAASAEQLAPTWVFIYCRRAKDSAAKQNRCAALGSRDRGASNRRLLDVFSNKFSVVQTMSTELPNRLIDKRQSKSKLSLIKPPNDRSRIARTRPRKRGNSRDHSEARGD
jgi:hypothetical protein